MLDEWSWYFNPYVLGLYAYICSTILLVHCTIRQVHRYSTHDWMRILHRYSARILGTLVLVECALSLVRSWISALSLVQMAHCLHSLRSVMAILTYRHQRELPTVPDLVYIPATDKEKVYKQKFLDAICFSSHIIQRSSWNLVPRVIWWLQWT